MVIKLRLLLQWQVKSSSILKRASEIPLRKPGNFSPDLLKHRITYLTFKELDLGGHASLGLAVDFIIRKAVLLLIVQIEAKANVLLLHILWLAEYNLPLLSHSACCTKFR